MVIVLVVAIVLVLPKHRELDLVSLDEDSPRLLGVRLGRTRMGFLTLAVLLTATAIAAVGTIGFVGLVAPHAARSLVGRAHARVVPVAVLLGAVLVCLCDLLGRTVIAPAHNSAPASSPHSFGTPYFVWLLLRTPKPGTDRPGDGPATSGHNRLSQHRVGIREWPTARWAPLPYRGRILPILCYETPGS
ncbi:iron chelate uptake ABC transporter family permease subunit [Sphingomonas sp. LR61]|uniref:iron chelate uptake ABC transporter family permease subunit n=1 Tax=Sphingomonas sp. LR61 TaxID=3050234 RepID=UPI003FA6A925